MQGAPYKVDLVFCVDVTGSMGPVLANVKNAALGFYNDLNRVLAEKGKVVDSLRARIVAYRDFYVDGPQALQTSRFFDLNKESEDFAGFVRGLVADGGGDEPENGLEAVAMSIKSEWLNDPGRRRQVVVVWTDASCHRLELAKEKGSAHYPPDMPANFDELTDLWEGQTYMAPTAKRLILFAPDAYPWTDIANNWQNAVHYASQAGAGLSDIDYNVILDAIQNSV
jgi:hypothetical protein